MKRRIPVSLLSSVSLVVGLFVSQRYQFSPPAKSAGVATAESELHTAHEFSWSHVAPSAAASTSLAASSNNGTLTSLFWHVPKSGGTTMKSFGACLRLVVADQHGGQTLDPPPSLQIITKPAGLFVDVDTCTVTGLQQAQALGYAKKQPAQVVYSPFVREAVEYIFDDTHQAKVFALFRDPVDRAVSLFYYLQDNFWNKTRNETLKSLTLKEYALDYLEDNYIMRKFAGKLPGTTLTPLDLEEAKQFLRDHVIVGLTYKVDESIQRFASIFGWDKSERWETCHGRAVEGKNRNPHPKLEHGSEVWNLLAAKNEYDIELYKYALELFTEQQRGLIA